MKTNVGVMNEIERLFAQWMKEVSQSSDLTVSTKKTYILHPDHFVRWCKDDFPIRGFKE